MPYSARENDADVLQFVRDNDIKWVLDIGAGSGTYGHLLRSHVERIEAVEVWEPYIKNFNLENIYYRVSNVDVREISEEEFGNFDLVIFGDILEHLSREDSMQVWERASEAKYGLISVPIVHYPQGAEFGNPYEVHVQEHMHPEDIRRDYGPFVFDKEYEVTGTFIKEF